MSNIQDYFETEQEREEGHVDTREQDEAKFLVFFKVNQELPLIGSEA